MILKSPEIFAAAAGCWLVLASSPPANADTLLNVSSTVSSTDPLESGRVTRDGNASNWSMQKTFPGINGSGNLFHYRTFNVFNGSALNCRYVQALLEDSSDAVFLSAYLDLFLPNPGAPNGGLDFNYLGDAGISTYYSGTEAGYLQVFVPPGHSLVLVVNELVANTGTDKPFRLLVEGFTDTQYTDTRPGIVSTALSNTNLLLAGTNGIAGRTYDLLTSTNAALPLGQWSPLATNVPPASGAFTLTVTNGINPFDRQRFFILQSPGD